jgi:hypothetical protein
MLKPVDGAADGSAVEELPMETRCWDWAMEQTMASRKDSQQAAEGVAD